MRDTIYLFTWLQEGKSAGHQLASPADLPTKVCQLANGTCRLANSRQIQPTHTSTYSEQTCREPSTVANTAAAGLKVAETSRLHTYSGVLRKCTNFRWVGFGQEMRIILLIVLKPSNVAFQDQHNPHDTIAENNWSRNTLSYISKSILSSYQFFSWVGLVLL